MKKYSPDSFTPGPWTWRPTGLVPERMATVNVIRSHNVTPYVSHADARLIAAAPDMLEVLKSIQHWLADANVCCFPREQLHAVIEKAEGRK